MAPTVDPRHQADAEPPVRCGCLSSPLWLKRQLSSANQRHSLNGMARPVEDRWFVVCCTSCAVRCLLLVCLCGVVVVVVVHVVVVVVVVKCMITVGINHHDENQRGTNSTSCIRSTN